MPRWESFNFFLQEAMQTPDPVDRQKLVNELLNERPTWPWIEGNKATFVYSGGNVQSVALNLDIIERDPPFDTLQRLENTSLWYVQRTFRRDDLLDYLLAVNDPMTPLREETDFIQRMSYWQPDARNPQRMITAEITVSVLRMPGSRPFPDWRNMANVPRGQIYEHNFDSARMGFSGRQVWVYTPPGYDINDDRKYPLLILLDGQSMVAPLQVPYMADALIKHGRMEPVVIAMKQSGNQATRINDYVSNDDHYLAMHDELVPFLADAYNIDTSDLGIGGMGVGAIAAAHCALTNPDDFQHLMMLSPPLGRGRAQEKLLQYADRFKNADKLPRYIFQSVGRYEQLQRFYIPGVALAQLLQQREHDQGDIDVDHKFVELGSGHSFVAFKSILPEALAHIYPAGG
ncbi:MAG: hypothetical protein CL607_09185 [Anaerolineaceae bacterium]|nr:hypothetical protein [Anaerolineaceae bacterium]